MVSRTKLQALTGFRSMSRMPFSSLSNINMSSRMVMTPLQLCNIPTTMHTYIHKRIGTCRCTDQRIYSQGSTTAMSAYLTANRLSSFGIFSESCHVIVQQFQSQQYGVQGVPYPARHVRKEEPSRIQRVLHVQRKSVC